MKRRDFLSLAAAWSLLPETAMAQAQHPFERLTDVNTERRFAPTKGQMALALFMTAQQNYASCGGAVIGVYQIINEFGVQDKIQPIFVVPRVSDQLNPNDRRNLARAVQYNMKILTGSLADVQAAARDVGAYFETNAQGRVTGHTLDAYLLSPSGTNLAHSRADNYLVFLPLVEQIVANCRKPEKAGLCL